MIKIYLSYNNSEKVVQLPVVPDELPKITCQLNNEAFATNTKTLTLLGSKKPKTFSLNLFLPTRDYEFAKGNGKEVIELIEYVAANRIPARIIITDGASEVLNMAVSISNFEYNYDTILNLRATIGFVEYIFLTEPQNKSIEVIKFEDVTIYYKEKSTKIKATNVDGSYLVHTRGLLNFLDINVGWNAEKKRVIAGKKLLDIHTRLYDGNAYCFIRNIVTEIGKKLTYNEVDKSITIYEEVKNEL